LRGGPEAGETVEKNERTEKNQRRPGQSKAREKACKGVRETVAGYRCNIKREKVDLGLVIWPLGVNGEGGAVKKKGGEKARE